MKRFFAFVAALVMGISTVSAQGFGAEAVAGMNVSDWGGLGDRVGFHVGIRGEYMTPVKGLYANAAALFTLKGCRQDYGDLLGKSRTDAYCVEFPIHVGYKFAVNDRFAVFGDAGPYVAVGLFGNQHVKSELGDSHVAQSTFVSYVRRFDVGVGLRLGVEFFQRYGFSVSYDWGLLDAVKNNDISLPYSTAMKHTNLMVSLSYKF